MTSSWSAGSSRRCRPSKVGAVLQADGGYAETVLAEFRREGVDDEALAARLQQEGADAFTKSWEALLARIREKCAGGAESVAARRSQ